MREARRRRLRPPPLLWRSDPSRDVAGEGEDRAHRLVARIGGRSEHARAAAVDHRDAVLAAVVGRLLRDAPVAGTPVHPDVPDPELGALVDRALGALGPGADDDAVDPAGNLAQVVVAAVALDLVRVRVDGEDLVAPLAQALVDDVAAVVLGLPGDTGDGDSLAG